MRRAVLAALLALSLSSELALAAEPPDAYMPDESAIPAGYDLRGELATQSVEGGSLEQWYDHEASEAILRVIAVAAESADAAESVCAAAGERLRADDYDVQPVVVDGIPGIVAERRLGRSYQRAAYLTSGPACLGVMTSGDEGRLPEAAETPILRAMMAKGRASST